MREKMAKSLLYTRMTAVAASRRLQSMPFTKFGGFNVAIADGFSIDPSVVKFSACSPITASRTRRFDCRQISQLVKSNGNGFVDTLALVRRLEAQGIPTKQAQAITAAMTNALNDSLEKVTQLYVSKEESQEVVSEKAQGDIEKSSSELWDEIDIDGEIVDLLSKLNIRKGHMRDRLANQTAKISKLDNKIDQAFHGFGAQLEVAKTEVIKNLMVTVVSISVVGVAILRFLA